MRKYRVSRALDLASLGQERIRARFVQIPGRRIVPIPVTTRLVRYAQMGFQLRVLLVVEPLPTQPLPSVLATPHDVP